MNQPQIELIPIRPVLTYEDSTTLDVLIRITPPVPKPQGQRPSLNLGLVIDRSGSMQGQAIQVARAAAKAAVEQLLPTDRVSITIFDDEVETLVPSRFADDKEPILQAIQRIQPGGSTALHAGWLEGGIQVCQHFHVEHLNRVIFLSDGQANVGETNPDTIATDVYGLFQKGKVSTTTMGMGNDYNEDLLQAMANSGDGNYYYIESPQQLLDIFQQELQGLMATSGHTVSLGLEPNTGAQIVDVLNNFESNTYGRLQLPNLIAGMPLSIVVRLKVTPPTVAQESLDVCTFRLAWDAPGTKERQEMKVSLKLGLVTVEESAGFPENPLVTEQVARLMASRARDEAVQELDQGNYDAAKAAVYKAKGELQMASNSEVIRQDDSLLDKLLQNLESGDFVKSRKEALNQSYETRRNRKKLSMETLKLSNCVTIWGIHAGKTEDVDDLFLRQNYIALGSPELGDLTKLNPTLDSFKAKMLEAWPGMGSPSLGHRAGQLFKFVHEMAVGDIVIYSSKQKRTVNLGRVVGICHHDPTINSSYPNLRAVQWLAAYPRTYFSQSALNRIDTARSLFKISSQGEFLAALENHTTRYEA